MNNSTNLPNRQSHRYRDYDYTNAGAYFVTICVRYGKYLLGHVEDGRMVLNPAGQAVLTCWNELPERFPTIALDEFQVMPNHAHGVVWLQANPSVAADHVTDTVGALLAAPVGVSDTTGAASSAPTDSETEANVILKPTLGQVMRTWKSKSAIAVNAALHRSGSLWLRNYWDRIIRDEQELANIRNYIRTNPQRWQEDQLHPDAPPNKWKQQWDDV